MRDRHPGGLARVTEQCVEPLLVAARGADVADARGAPGHAGQLGRVLDQRGELEHRSRAPAQSARGRKDGGLRGWHPLNVPNVPSVESPARLTPWHPEGAWRIGAAKAPCPRSSRTGVVAARV